MNSKLIKAKENNFIYKIRKIFCDIKIKLFGKHKDIEEEKKRDEKENASLTETNEEENFFDEIKVDNIKLDKILKKNDFLKELKGNEQLLNKLSNKRLIQLEEYYEQIIEKNEKIIKNLKTNI